MSEPSGSLPKKRPREWYSVSIDAVRLTLALSLLIGTGVAAYAGYQRWSSYHLEQKAFENVAKSDQLLGQLVTEPTHRAYLSELDSARSTLDRARLEIEQERFREAAATGQVSVDVLQDVLMRIRRSGSIAWFRSVEGDVRYRRGENGEFLRAYPRVELDDGDYVRSGSNASAEVHFREDDTVFTLRPKSLIKLGRELVGDQQTLGFMEYGWVRLDTSKTPSGLRTPFSDLRVAESSRVTLELPENGSEETLQVAEGTAEVRSLETGEVRVLGERQQVTQSKQSFGDILQLPPEPLLASPPDDYSINIDTTNQLVLEWTAVPEVRRYALQVSRNRLFAENLVEASDRSRTTATLGLEGQGTFLWRVACYGKNGTLGPWSEPRSFRVSSYRRLDLEADAVPPPIEVEIIVNGYYATLRGKTEPGATLTMNGDSILLAADGSFSTTSVLEGRGRVALEFRATDRSGNTSTERRFVFLDGG